MSGGVESETDRMFPVIAIKKTDDPLARKGEVGYQRHEQENLVSLSQPSLPSPSQKSPRKQGINVQSSQQSQIFISTDPNNSHLPSTEDQTQRAPTAPAKGPQPCPHCQRMFKEASYKKHVKVCKKVFFERREKFDSHKHRIEGAPMATLASSSRAAPSTSTDKPKWKVASEAFRQAIKQAKVLFAISLKKANKTGTLPSEPNDVKDRAQKAPTAPAKGPQPCPHCQRMFKEASYKKHVKVCKKVFFERREKFDSHKHRIEGAPMATLASSSRASSTASNGRITPKPASDKPKWKVASETFRQDIKQAKLLFARTIKKSNTYIPLALPSNP